MQDGELRLRGAQRQLLAAVGQPRGELAVLQLVLALDELGGDDPALADLAQPVELLAEIALRPALRLAQRSELVAREEVGVAGDDLGLLGGLLLADAYGPALLRALEEKLLEPRLEIEGRVDACRRHGPESTCRR